MTNLHLRCSLLLYFVHFSSTWIHLMIQYLKDRLNMCRISISNGHAFNMRMRFPLVWKMYLFLLPQQYSCMRSTFHINTLYYFIFLFRKLLCMLLTWWFRLLFSIGCGFSSTNWIQVPFFCVWQMCCAYCFLFRESNIFFFFLR